jgi:hypothetical protein
LAQRRVQHAVLLQQERERDADRGRRQHVREKDDRLVFAHTADAIVQHQRDREPEPEHHRHREEQLQVVQQGLAERLVGDHALEVVEADPDRRPEAARVETVAHDLYKRKAERERHRADGRQGVEIGPEHPSPASPTTGALVRHRAQPPETHFV